MQHDRGVTRPRTEGGMIRTALGKEMERKMGQIAELRAELAELHKRMNRYHSFFVIWQRCELNRGCYSCCTAHDIRCPCAEDPDVDSALCECGRAELDKAEEALTSRGG